MRRTTHRLVALLAFSLAAVTVAPSAALAQVAVAGATREQVRSEVLGEDRVVEVSLPTSYGAGDARYPVLYLLDGETHLEHGVGVSRFLAEAGRVPELIIVAVHNLERPAERCCRFRDFTPVPAPKFRIGGHPAAELDPTAGGADRFLEFLTAELIPRIDARYRTAPFRVLFGHSLSGLFALHTFQARPDVFRGVIVASPALWWNDGALVATVPKAAAGLAPLERSLFFACGDEDEAMVGPLRRLEAALGAIPAARLRHHFTRLREEDHMTSPHLTLYTGLRFVFEGWQVPEKLVSVDIAKLEVAPIVAHFARLSDRFGFVALPPEILLNNLGYALLGAKRKDAALVALAQNAAFHPRSANAQDSWADALAENGRLTEAVSAAERAVTLATETKAPLLEEYRRRAGELRARLAATGASQRP